MGSPAVILVESTISTNPTQHMDDFSEKEMFSLWLNSEFVASLRLGLSCVSVIPIFENKTFLVKNV